MTKQEAFKEITSRHKWYIGYCSQGYASLLVQRFEAGQLKEKTVNAFLTKFGYKCVKNEEWKSIKTKK